VSTRHLPMATNVHRRAVARLRERLQRGAFAAHVTLLHKARAAARPPRDKLPSPPKTEASISIMAVLPDAAASASLYRGLGSPRTSIAWE
jgi:hypothetical protein